MGRIKGKEKKDSATSRRQEIGESEMLAASENRKRKYFKTLNLFVPDTISRFRGFIY